ncbi:ISAs1 family transposase [Thiococcus pfennigii]|nr:ISAs1 family transposase [Thiococcus pfennigii]MBK1733650.1 ISAs1 family transposase [Thiococcus pfennigii]
MAIAEAQEVTLDSDRSLIKHFSHLEDPRDGTKARHKLLDMIAIAVAAVICGADDWVSIAGFARAKEAWLRQFLELPNGIPSHDTFGRVFSLLAPQAFEECFRAWVNTVRQSIPEEVVAIDGKSVRRSHNRGAGLGPLHMVSAWAVANRVVLGQVATEAKSNEITAIPRLLELLVLKGCIVTIDAMGCQTKIAEQIIAAGGDYVLALKGNQGTLAEEVEEAFIDADAKDYAGLDAQVFETSERNHGRIETRRYYTLGHLDGLSRRALWKGLNMIGMVESQREVDGKTSTEYRFYIGSIGTDAERFARAVRGHWGIENDLHWSLDVAFREDDSRLRNPQARENFAVLRHIALTRLKNDTREKMGIKNKRLKAGWDDKYLSELLFQTG